MKKILFCGGGSAGHVMPNIAIIEDLKGRYDIFYAGTGGIEKDICNTFGVPFYEFGGVKFKRGRVLANLKIPFALFKSVKEAKKIIEETKPDLVFCKGGYASLPPAIAAKIKKIPVITHESDLSLGLANKIISRFAVCTLCSFPETAAEVNRGRYSGTPMRRAISRGDKVKALKKFGLDMRPTILAFGGGSGSRKINAALREIAEEVCKNYNILHICGKGNAVPSTIYGYKQIEFCDDMGAAYACAGYALARCGSNSAHELLALKIPTLFIPLENRSSRGDQVANAEYFLKEGVCRVLKESELTPERLNGEIKKLIADKKIKSALAKREYGRGNVAVINEITKVLQQEF